MDRAGSLAGAVSAVSFATLIVLAGCKDSTAPLQRDLDALRAATAAFADIDAAAAQGYTAALTGCMTDAQGAMGYHIGNENLIDATVELTKPEVVMYEPTASGGRTLVGLEFLVPFDQWTLQMPPALMGQSFKRNEAFQVWALHVWLYRNNPAGMFADWNASVSCAQEQATAVHHH